MIAPVWRKVATRLASWSFWWPMPLAKGCDLLITPGAVQSNHVRMTAAAAARFGMKCHAVLERRVTETDADYEENGNILLDELFGCSRSYVPGGSDVAAACAAVAEDFKAKGAKPYIIPAVVRTRSARLAMLPAPWN